MTRKQQDYNQSINLISHLILTNPTSVVELLASYGVIFPAAPNRSQLIDGVIEMMSEDTKFTDDLGDLITIHVEKNGKEILELAKGYDSFHVEDQEEDEFFGSLLKTGIKLVGGLLKKKRRPAPQPTYRPRSTRSSYSRRRSSTNSAALSSAKAEARRVRQQMDTMRRDLQRQMQQIRSQAQQEKAQLRSEISNLKTQHRREIKDKEKELRDTKEAGKRTLFMVAGGLGLLAIIGFGMAFTKKSRAIAPYVPPVPVAG